MRHTKQQVAAVDLAREEVDRYFSAIIEDREAFRNEGVAEEGLDAAFEKVSDVLEREWVETNGRPIKDTDDLDRWYIGMSAGYLIGVQVGLRLRNVGGAR